MEITRRIEFDAGHRVPGHVTAGGQPGKCASPHGHRYRLEVTVDGEIPADGMVIDFGIVKQVLMEHVDGRFDHAMIVWEQDRELLDAMGVGDGWKVAVIPHPPTAEFLLAEIASMIEGPLWEHGVQLVGLRLYETPNAWADWRQP